MSELRLETARQIIVKKCRHGYFMFNRNDIIIGRSLDLYGEWSESEIGVLAQVIRPGDFVVDIGAHIGTHTVAFSAMAGAQGAVIAFEPQRFAFQTLCGNVALNGLTNVLCFNQAVGAARGKLTVPVLDPFRPTNFGGLNIEGKAKGETVEIVPLDDLGLTDCRVIKADVEGMEIEVLKGAKATIQRYRPVLFLENNTVDRAPALFDMLADLDYRAWWHISSYFNPENFNGVAENIFKEVRFEANLLCFHRSVGAAISGMPELLDRNDNWLAAQARLIGAAAGR